MSDLPAQVLLTLSTLGYSLIPAIFDSNNTHMTNPLWVPHARFHVVWQVVTYVCVAILALYFIWGDHGDGSTHLWYAALLSVAAYFGFFTAVATTKLYGGATYDPNGVIPYRPPFIGRYMAFEVNITLFTAAISILIMGMLCIVMAHVDGIPSSIQSAIWIVMMIATTLLVVTMTIFVGAFIRRKGTQSSQQDVWTATTTSKM